MTTRPDLGYHLGCPVWACDGWRGTLFAEKAPRRAFLAQYSAAFDTVEGNSTFYGLPSLETARRWADESVDGFRFALKFPRTISHDQRLVAAARETADFLEVLSVLDEAGRLGPSFLQLPPDFEASRFDVLVLYLRGLPGEWPFAVEVRHESWFDDGPHEGRLDALLREVGMDRVTFDTRALYSAPPSDDWECVSQTRKPLVPLRHTVTGRHPFVRFVGRNDIGSVTRWIEEWADVVADWIDGGYEPYVFTHAPDDRCAPEFARTFHAAIRERLPDTPDLPEWPGEIEAARPVQRSLF